VNSFTLRRRSLGFVRDWRQGELSRPCFREQRRAGRMKWKYAKGLNTGKPIDGA
jgi:hypothetical protein